MIGNYKTGIIMYNQRGREKEQFISIYTIAFPCIAQVSNQSIYIYKTEAFEAPTIFYVSNT